MASGGYILINISQEDAQGIMSLNELGDKFTCSDDFKNKILQACRIVKPGYLVVNIGSGELLIPFLPWLFSESQVTFVLTVYGADKECYLTFDTNEVGLD